MLISDVKSLRTSWPRGQNLSSASKNCLRPRAFVLGVSLNYLLCLMKMIVMMELVIMVSVQ